MNEFKKEVMDRIHKNGVNTTLNTSAHNFICASTLPKYSYNFTALGRPIIQYPQDMVAMQELIWEIKPDLIIETGIAHGGSLIMSASMLALLDMCDAIESGATLNPRESNRKVLGFDIDIRAQNREAIEAHPMASRIQMIQGSSIAPEVVEQVRQVAKSYERILVCLDSKPHARACAGGVAGLCAADQRRQLLCGVRYHYRGHARRYVPRLPLGPRRQPENRRLGIFENPF